MRLRKASILSDVPVISMVSVSGETSTTRPRKTSTQLITSERVLESAALTLTRASSRVTMFSGSRLATLTTSMSLFICLTICSRVLSSPMTVMVIRERPFCSVWPTVMLSMLKSRRRNMLATLWSTPGLFSTNAAITMVLGFSILVVTYLLV